MLEQGQKLTNKGPVVSSSTETQNEIDLLELLSDIWKQRWFVGGCALATFAMSVAYLKIATPSYTAELRLTPAQQTQTGSTSGFGGGLAGLASLTGVSMRSDPGSMAFMLYREGVHSRSLAAELMKRSDIVKMVFEEEWNTETRRFSEPRYTFLTRVLKTTRTILGSKPTPWTPPSAARMEDYIQDRVELTEEAEDPIITLTFRHHDPRFATEFLMRIHEVLDNRLREKSRARTTQYIGYLSRQLRSTTVAELRGALAQTLSEQEKSLMVANSTLAYAAEPIDGATTSLQPTHPRNGVVLLIGTLLGMFIGAAIALVRAHTGQNWDKRTRLPLPETAPANAGAGSL
jgi:LPS O-antigen subunit length determinant protein (WzzB/FepE family)